MSKRIEQAMEVLAAGGYIRHALETDRYTRREQFKVRLRDANGNNVSGFGFKTFFALRDSGRLTTRDCPRGSTWPTEYVLAR